MTGRDGRWAMKVRPLLVIALVLVLLLAGCGGKRKATGLYADADQRIHESFTDAGSRNATLKVVEADDRLVIRAKLNLDGGSRVSLFDPSGNEMHSDDRIGGHNTTDHVWYQREDPASGSWRLQIEARGAGEFRFGVYRD
jgi:hypothetical protein